LHQHFAIHLWVLPALQPEIQVNAANWDVAALQGAGGAGNDDQQQEEDKLWEQFQTVDETKKKQVAVL
jgi:hypothetical protein